MKLNHNERKFMGFSQQHLPYLSYLCKCIFSVRVRTYIDIHVYIYIHWLCHVTQGEHKSIFRSILGETIDTISLRATSRSSVYF